MDDFEYSSIRLVLSRIPYQVNLGIPRDSKDFPRKILEISVSATFGEIFILQDSLESFV